MCTVFFWKNIQCHYTGGWGLFIDNLTGYMTLPLYPYTGTVWVGVTGSYSVLSSSSWSRVAFCGPTPFVCFLYSSHFCYLRNVYCTLRRLRAPSEASDRLRGTSCTLRRSSGGFGPPSGYLLHPSAVLRRLRPPSGYFLHPSAVHLRSCTVLFAGLVGPVGCPYDKPLAVDVLLRHG